MSLKLLSTCIMYGVLFILGFFVSIPIAVTRNKFSGFCLMYEQAIWDQDTFIISDKSNTGTCNFNVYFHVASTILYAGIMAGLHIFLFVRTIRGQTIKLPIPLRVAIAVVNGIVVTMTLVSACIISAGFNAWCSNLVQGPITDCSDARAYKIRIGKKTDIDGSSFHTSYLMAIICCWLVLILWSIIFGIETFILVRKHRRRMAGGGGARGVGGKSTKRDAATKPVPSTSTKSLRKETAQGTDWGNAKSQSATIQVTSSSKGNLNKETANGIEWGNVKGQSSNTQVPSSSRGKINKETSTGIDWGNEKY